ncbi:hypothetical protein D9611_010474 [Ephemerocybe angulata]|uniref:BTB domain-containing protein n=1 Tax=Ephemerocybe angulata TaxID=980116 RepID=A0A8H5FB08_9AGAR|nr:hypothetical protein D9611_010474 [Tulosesus angulatus]
MASSSRGISIHEVTLHAGTDEYFHPDFSDRGGDVALVPKGRKRLFRTHTFTLKSSSGFFRSKLDRPRSSTSQKVQVVYLDEEEVVLEYLLRMVSGMEFPELDSCDLVEDLLQAAVRLEMTGPVDIIRLALTSPPLATMNPFRMYDICFRNGWDAEARLFATQTLASNLLDGGHSQLEGRSPTGLLRLLEARQTRREM